MWPSCLEAVTQTGLKVPGTLQSDDGIEKEHPGQGLNQQMARPPCPTALGRPSVLLALWGWWGEPKVLRGPSRSESGLPAFLNSAWEQRGTDFVLGPPAALPPNRAVAQGD